MLIESIGNQIRLFDISICGNIKMIGVASEIESRKINWDQYVTQA